MYIGFTKFSCSTTDVKLTLIIKNLCNCLLGIEYDSSGVALFRGVPIYEFQITVRHYKDENEFIDKFKIKELKEKHKDMAETLKTIFQDAGLTGNTITGCDCSNYYTISSGLITQRDLDSAKEEILDKVLRGIDYTKEEIVDKILEGIREDQCADCDCNQPCDCCECEEEIALELPRIFINEAKKIVTAVDSEDNKYFAKNSDKDEFDPVVGVALVLAYSAFGSKTQFKKFVKQLLNSQKKPSKQKISQEAKDKENEQTENN